MPAVTMAPTTVAEVAEYFNKLVEAGFGKTIMVFYDRRGKERFSAKAIFDMKKHIFLEGYDRWIEYQDGEWVPSDYKPHGELYSE